MKASLQPTIHVPRAKRDLDHTLTSPFAMIVILALFGLAAERSG